MILKNKNILITGISGFAGSWLSKHLLDKGLRSMEFSRKNLSFAFASTGIFGVFLIWV